MQKKKITLPDGRYLIYYTFGKSERPISKFQIPNSKSPQARGQ